MQIMVTLLLSVALYSGYYVITDSLDRPSSDLPEYKVTLVNKGAQARSLKGINQYAAISRAPLFTESRKLVKPEKTKKIRRKVVVQQALSIKALGIALSGDGVIAVVKDLKNGKILRLGIQDKIYGWTLSSVSDGQFSFTKGSRSKIIKFKN